MLSNIYGNNPGAAVSGFSADRRDSDRMPCSCYLIFGKGISLATLK